MQIRLYPILLALLAGACFTSCGGDHPPDSEKPAETSQASDSLAGGVDASGGGIKRLLDQYDPPGRDIWQKPEVVIGKMGDLQRKVVADIGAGSGFFSRRLAQQAKKVIAIEVDERFVHFMDSIKRVELKPEYQSRLEVRLATPTDSKLKAGEADIILIVNTYIYLEDRIAYLRHLLELMPEGGKVIIVDFKRKRIPINYPLADIRLELFQVENELEKAGFVNFESDDCALDYQYIVVAEKRT